MPRITIMCDCNHFANVISLVESKPRMPNRGVPLELCRPFGGALKCFRVGEIAKGNAGMRERKLYDRTL